MSEKKGMIMQYTDKSGNVQRCEMLYYDQKICKGNTDKAFVRLINENGHPLKESGQDVNKIILFEKLTRIGFID
jgi:hypothetical protein